jgi:hypothetical protein
MIAYLALHSPGLQSLCPESSRPGVDVRIPLPFMSLFRHGLVDFRIYRTLPFSITFISPPSPSFSSFNDLTVLQFVKFEEGLGMCLWVSAPPLLLLPNLLSPLHSFPMSLITFHFCRSRDKIIPVLLCRGLMLSTRQKARHALLHAYAHHTHLSLHAFLRVVALPQEYCCTPLTR